jgi:hypothetical protein
MPIDARKCVMQAMTASATSSGSTTRFSGVLAASYSSASRPRPATKSVATAPGDTHRKRTSGPKARAIDIVIVSRAALAAP